VFFLLDGYHVDLASLSTLGILSGVYILGRTLGGVLAGYAGATLGGFSKRIRNNIGLCMLPQAGVALGLALLAAQRFPEYAVQILPVVVGPSVLFEIAGPLLTRFALHRAGEIRK
jgi:Kef-type K+ transport system membrane component KefB